MTQQTPFEKWWYDEGSQAPYTHHDCEEHTKRMCEIAWANGADKEREACAAYVESVINVDLMSLNTILTAIAEEIRARGEE